ncbi:MAG: GNAT family N-acetyltransferase [Acidimicrobiia bacterium]
MGITVTATSDAAAALAEARAFLTSRPAEHNVVLTLLSQRAGAPRPGRYWVARDGDRVVGVVFLSPLDFHAAVTPCSDEVIDALVRSVGDDVPDLTGVAGDAATAARFAGEWAARAHVGARPAEAQRLHVLDEVRKPTAVPGMLRPGRLDEIDVIAAWNDGFVGDTGEGRRAPEEARPMLQGVLDDRRLFVWDDGGPTSMASLSPTVAGSVRVQRVYTPPERRRHGYASACVAAVTAHALKNGATTCVLYTQLSNPTSNAIYRTIGYEPIAEILRYRFG